MQFVIFDFEWNCVTLGKDRHLNEIIEIGAVKLDEKFTETDRFSSFVRPKFTNKLNKYVKNLTHINEEDLKKASDFVTVLSEFEKFSSGDDTVFLSWSDTDMHVLSENCRQFLSADSAGFICKYADLQRYAMKFLKTETKNQVSLSNAAEQFGISNEGLSLHRACDDSRLCAKILQKTYDKRQFAGYIRVLDRKYYQRLMFKPYYVTSQDDPDFDISDFSQNCPHCKKPLSATGKIKHFKNVFTQKYLCKHCNKRYKIHIKIKKTYDGAVKNIRLNELK